MTISACLTSNNDYWKTPKKLYDYYINRGYFDPCPSNPTFNGLEVDWKSNNFVNPPYSMLSSWVDKSLVEFEKGHLITLLIPARTDTRWFKKLFDFGCIFYFIQGRLKFNDGSSCAPFPSMLVVLLGNKFSTLDLIAKNERFWEVC